MNIRRIMPNISTNRVEESRKFYTELFGLNLVMDMGWILMFASPSNETAQLSILQGGKPESTGEISITIEVEDVDETHKEALARGVEPVYPLTVESYGVKRFKIKDPNGVTINVMSHV